MNANFQEKLAARRQRRARHKREESELKEHKKKDKKDKHHKKDNKISGKKGLSLMSRSEIRSFILKTFN